MAVLSKNENLICESAKSTDKLSHYAFELTKTFIIVDCKLKEDNSDYKYFDYLYCHNHSDKTFDYIVREVLCTSLSTLEDRRKKFIVIFNFYLDLVENDFAYREVAFTKNI